jgi:ABC-type bacteriocin/lantibiotic exporter with double-glycine peptidase domain
MSVILEIGIIAAPFYIQLALDQVIASGDVDLLVVLAVGFALMTTVTVAGKALRSLTVLNLQNTLHFAMGSRLFHHLVRLPLAYFEKRHIGDILSRFISLEPIRNVVAEGLITAIIDGLMGIVTLTVVFLYSPVLGGVIVARLLALPDFAIGAVPAIPRTQRNHDPQQGAGKFGADRDTAGNPEPQALQPRNRAGKPVAKPLCQCHQCRRPYRPHKDPVHDAQRSDLRA